MKPIRYVPFVAIITAIAAIIAYWVIYNNNLNYTNQEKEILNRFTSNFESVLTGQERAANLFYNQVIASDKIMDILKKVPESYGKEKDELRSQLYNELKDNYAKLAKQNFRQLHFHLSSGESFLRFHRPDKYGDNLFPVRYSIEKANKTLKMAKGFEEGRIFNGYRFVFPILDGENHYGSVEVSVSFLAISEAIKEIENVNTTVLFKKDIIDQKVFESEKSNYNLCKAAPDYVFDKSIEENQNEKISYQLFNQIASAHKEKFEKILKQKYATLNDILYDNQNYLLINIPIPNVKGKQIGNIFIFYKNDELKTIKESIYGKLSILILMYLIMFLSGIIIIKRDRKIIKSRELAKKSEEILTESDEIKSRLFEIITHDLRNHFNAVNGFLDLLNKRINLNDDKINKLYHGLNDAVELTNSLMDNLFVWSRMHIDKIETTKTRFEASSWLQKELTRFKTIMKRKEITLINNTKGTVYFNADVDMMKYIHQNILLNAIRYSSKKGKITTQIVDHGTHTTLTIKDEGKGMSNSEVSNILNQDSWSGSKIRNEIGLGLLITRKLIDYQNGKFQIESAKGVGTTVTVEIPK